MNFTEKNISKASNPPQDISPWLIAIIVMIPTVIVGINGSVANVALSNIAAGFSMSTDDASWILTAYFVANGIILPLTAWFSNMFGRKNFLIICVIIFLFGSVACGLAPSFNALVIARIIQGLGGGAIMPIAQSILLERFPIAKRTMAMSIYGAGIMLAPVLGPVLGGWITDNYSWHWIFYINLPFAILAIILASLFINDPPNFKKKVEGIDYIGLFALISWLVTQQIILDKGQRADWFQSQWVCELACVAVISMIFFFYWEFHCKNAIIDLNVFKNRNFIAGCLISAVMMAVLFGTITILPLFLQDVLNYTATDSGSVMTYRGISCMIVIASMGYVSSKVNVKFVIAIGFILWAISFLLFSDLNLAISKDSLILPNLLCGAGMGMFYAPLTTITFETLSLKHMTNATGLYNLIRNIGASVGISITNTVIINNSQVHQSYLTSNLSPTSLILQRKIQLLQHFLSIHMNPVIATHKAYYLIYNSLIQQSTLMAYMDVFKLYAIMSLILVPTVLIFKRVKNPQTESTP